MLRPHHTGSGQPYQQEIWDAPQRRVRSRSDPRRDQIKLKTSMGVSDEFYSNCQAFPIYGTGQGSGNSPTIWCIISSVLFECHKEKGHGAYFCTPDQQMPVSLSMIGFVDDITGQVNSFVSNTQPTKATRATIFIMYSPFFVT